jgi:tetratricopeptide (TPR) repeat protein
MELDAMFETDKAVDELLTVIRSNPLRPQAAEARARLQLARAYDRLGHRTLAVAEYEAVERLAPESASSAFFLTRAREGLSYTPDQETTEAYRLSLEGLRALEGGSHTQAVSLLQRAVLMNPMDAVARYRYARALNAAGDRSAARDQFEQVMAVASTVAASIRAGLFVDYAAILEHVGERARAIETYKRARDMDGGTSDAREAARVALARLAS